MAITDKLITLFDKYGFELSHNVICDIEFNLMHNKYVNKHFAFIVDSKTGKVICHDSNVYYKYSFPISQHAEVKTICKYYSNVRSIPRQKKHLIVVKISKTGCLSNSKCCINCVRFIRNNYENLLLKNIYYSIDEETLGCLNRDDLYRKDFCLSKGYSSRMLTNKKH